MSSKAWKWALGLIYIIIVATIWIAASFVVQSVVDAGVSPFLITYICNSLFIVYIPISEIGHYLEDSYGSLWFWNSKDNRLQKFKNSEDVNLLQDELGSKTDDSKSSIVEEGTINQSGMIISRDSQLNLDDIETFPSDQPGVFELGKHQHNSIRRWTHARVAKVSLLICPFWFLAQLSFNFSLKYTTVTSNTILSSASSLFTFLVSLAFLGEKFTWVKLLSVLLCMGGTVIVSLGDSKAKSSAIAANPALGDIFALVSAAFYAAYITLIRKKLPDDDDGESDGHPSMAQFLGFLGLFNFFLFLPVALLLNFTKMEPFNALTWKQLSLIIGKGFLDNVLSDYLWAKAVLLTSTTVATAGLTIQVPLAAFVDSVSGNTPHAMDYVGAVAVMVGFAGINLPSDAFCRLPKELKTYHTVS